MRWCDESASICAICGCSGCDGCDGISCIEHLGSSIELVKFFFEPIEGLGPGHRPGAVRVGAPAFGREAFEYVEIDAPRSVLFGGGALLILIGFMSLSRDHRVSDTIASILLLAMAGAAGWLTFYAPEGTLQRYLPFIPQSVNEALDEAPESVNKEPHGDGWYCTIKLSDPAEIDGLMDASGYSELAGA